MSFDFVENFTLELPDFSGLECDFSESFNSKHGLIIEVAAIHEGLTANYNNYSAAELEKALLSWVEPYPKPIILNHDLNTEPIGRVIAARMDTEADGSSYVRLQVAITDPVAIEKVLDKRYLTGSVGGRAGKALCSISGEDLAQETENGRPRIPKFKRGKVYKGKLAYIDMQDISFKEYSFVNQPADQKSGVRSTSVADGKAQVSASDDWVARSSAFVLHMDDDDIISVKENKSIFSGMKKKSSRTAYLQTKGAFLSALAFHESETEVKDDESLLSNEDFETKKSEEFSIMDNNTQDEDILSVTAGLSEDLSNIASTQADENVDESSNEEAVADTDESVEQSNENNDSTESKADDESEEISSENPEEADVHDVNSENAGESDETSVDKTDEKEESDEGSLTTEQSSDEQSSEDSSTVTAQLALLEAQVQGLQAENAKLKSALHMTLVERVVDTKIAKGVAEESTRDEMIKTHSTRTASSLADTLRDLATIKPVKKISMYESDFNLDSESLTDLSESVVLDISEEQESSADPVDHFEQLLVDALMGRRKL